MTIAARLKKTYRDSGSALLFSTPFELLVAVILSAQTTDVQVNKTTPSLFRKFHTPEDFAAADAEEIASAVRSINFFRTKAKNIKRLSEMLLADFEGRVPDTLEQLTRLPGVARKTANVVLAQAFKKAEGIVVDTHVRRVSGRLGLTINTDPVKIEQDLMKLLPKKEWIGFSFRLILHGRKVCSAQKPDCVHCELNDVCAFYREQG